MDWVIAAMGLLSTWMLGNKLRSGWIVKMLSIAPWMILIYQKRLWGFLIPSLVNFYLCIGAYRKWKVGQGASIKKMPLRSAIDEMLCVRQRELAQADDKKGR